MKTILEILVVMGTLSVRLHHKKHLLSNCHEMPQYDLEMRYFMRCYDTGRVTSGFTLQRAKDAELCSFLNNHLNKHSSRRWIEMPWRKINHGSL